MIFPATHLAGKIVFEMIYNVSRRILNCIVILKERNKLLFYKFENL